MHKFTLKVTFLEIWNGTINNIYQAMFLLRVREENVKV